MKKRFISLMLLIAMAAAVLPPTLAVAEGDSWRLEDLLGTGEYSEPVTMYVKTSGGSLNVRSEPMIKPNNTIGKLAFGTEVTVTGRVVIDPDWYVIKYPSGPNGLGYVHGRYLSTTKPSKPNYNNNNNSNNNNNNNNNNNSNNNNSTNYTYNNNSQEEAERKARELAELNRQLASARSIDEPFLVAVRATRTSGWINFRVGPGVAADRITALEDGHQLLVIGETSGWYQAIDQQTGKTGYISKNYVSALPTPPKKQEEPVVPEKQGLGQLTVNGSFTLECRLPEGYKLQVVNVQGAKIVASVLPEDKEKPVLYLSIAYDEMYSEVGRMNDLSDEQLKELEESFTQLDDVAISYTETSHGTKLMVAREVREGTDYVDFLTVYQGYNIEFIMVPNPEGASKVLTDEQIAMCVDFLSDLDFNPDN